MQQTEGFKRLEARKKRLLALSNMAKPKASQSLIVPGTYCVINRKPEEFLLDDKHTSSLTLKTNKLFKILEITKFDDHLNIPKDVKVQDMMTGRILQFDCNRLQHLHLADAFDVQLQLSDLVKEFPPSTITQIKNRPPLISFKAGNGVFEDENPITIQQFPYAELYSHEGNDANKIQDEDHDLQSANDQEEEINSVNTLRTQPTEIDNGANIDESRAILEDTNENDNIIDNFDKDIRS